MALLSDRNGCALQGAAALYAAIPGVVPVLHANAGCASACGVDAAFAGTAPASTTLREKQVVFGGTARLREQLKNTLQVQQGRLYGVLVGCVPEVIGDDVPAMIKEAREQRFAAFAVSVPGFRGHGWAGHAAATRALLEHAALAEPEADAAAAPDLNLLGLAPGLEPGWDNDLAELAAVLARAGVATLPLAGPGAANGHWRAAARARASVALSAWGVDGGQWLEQAHGVALVVFGWLPVGSRDVALLLERLAPRLALDPRTVQAVATQLDAELRQALTAAATRGLLAELPARVALVGASVAALGQARFLAGSLGLQIAALVLTDEPPPAVRALLEQAAPVAITYADSAAAIAAALSGCDADAIIGSAWEAPLATTLGAAFVEASAPLAQRPMLARCRAGVRGALLLVEDLITAMRARRAALARPTQGEPK